ncbi:hypothetical protein [Methanoregula sp.]|jgi:hypothetical protein
MDEIGKIKKGREEKTLLVQCFKQFGNFQADFEKYWRNYAKNREQ